MDWGDAAMKYGPEVAKLVGGVAGATGANAVTQEAYQAILKNLHDRFADYGALGPANYQPITAQHLGPSALAGIPDDGAARIDEQNAIGQLDDIARSGGLTLADKAALNELEGKLNRNSSARSKSLANQYAARGQLGAGAQMAMDLDQQQNAAENANQRSEGIAAQAQQRAMDAVLKKAGLSRNMSNDDYSRKRAAAEAADAIAQHNATWETDASKYNNTIEGQRVADELAKLSGQTKLTDSMNNALLGSGRQNANTIAGVTSAGTNFLGSVGKGSGGSSGTAATGGGSTDTPTSTYAGDNNANLQPDPSDPGAGGETDVSIGNDEEGYA